MFLKGEESEAAEFAEFGLVVAVGTESVQSKTIMY